jgi:hypothetical protein
MPVQTGRLTVGRKLTLTVSAIAIMCSVAKEIGQERQEVWHQEIGLSVKALVLKSV